MDESSEKRRQRLQAMRMEASSSSSSSSSSQNPASPIPPPQFQPLSNPLIHPSPPLAGDDRSQPVPRFDYYTDPMSAFSGAKRRPGGPPYRSPPVNFSSPVRNHSPMFYPSPPTAGHSPYRSPPVNFSPSIRGQSSMPHPFPPANFSSPIRGHSPMAYSSPCTPNARTPWRSPAQFPYSPNRNASPSSHSNSGRGGRGGTGGRDGSLGGRGPGGYGNKVQHFYIKAMVKDPWRKLKPIVGNILVPMAGADSWMPKSITAAGTKRAKLGESGSGSKSQNLSLAEHLAQVMKEAANSNEDLS